MSQNQSPRVIVTMPDDVKSWLKRTAKYNGGTNSSEVVRALRAAMEAAGIKGETVSPRRDRQRQAAGA